MEAVVGANGPCESDLDDDIARYAETAHDHAARKHRGDQALDAGPRSIVAAGEEVDCSWTENAPGALVRYQKLGLDNQHGS